MTTIAWDGKTLAVDRGSWKGGYVWSEVSKLRPVILNERVSLRLGLAGNATAVWAPCGNACDVPLVMAWMADGGKDDVPTLAAAKTESLGILLIGSGPRMHRPTAFELTAALTTEQIESAPYAAGGGHEMALGAMLAGADARRAIEIVASRSSWAAGGVDSFTVGEGFSGARS